MLLSNLRLILRQLCLGYTISESDGRRKNIKRNKLSHRLKQYIQKFNRKTSALQLDFELATRSFGVFS